MLLLIRHADAETMNAAGDHARTLADSGLRQLPALADWFQRHLGKEQARMLVSDARRTQQTGEALAARVQVRPCFEPRIYEASLASLLALLDEHHDADYLAMVGHNPGLSELASHLTGQRIGLPTAGAVALDQQHRLISRHPGS